MFYISIVEFLRYSHLCEIRKNNFISKNLYKKIFSIKFPTSPLLCRNYPIFLFNFPTSFVNAKKIPFQLLAKPCWFSSNQSNSGMLESEGVGDKSLPGVCVRPYRERFPILVLQWRGLSKHFVCFLWLGCKCTFLWALKIKRQKRLGSYAKLN